MTKTKTEDLKDIKMVEGLISFSDKICKLCSKVENIQGKKPEIIVLLIYAVAHMIISFFHEPWYDEAVAWQIARSASLSDILFQIPHYEGHPPLWHLILLPFAKLGAPYELSLSLVSLIFAGLAVGLIVFKSPFPRIIRLLIPFTYFFFYQYGVISRPYCVMMLAFVLLAIVYKKRNEKPWEYTVSLAFLCLTSLYGMIFAGGLAVVWLWEIWGLRNIKAFIISAFKDKRIWCLAGLLVFALVLVVEILPKQDTYAIASRAYEKEGNNLIDLLIYTLVIMPADVCITTVFNFYGPGLRHTYLDIPSVLCGVFIGSILWAMGIYLGKRKGTLGELFVPYVLFAVFSALGYMYLHHIGIAILFFIFWIWISLQEETVHRTNKKLSKQSGALVKFVSLAICCIAVVTSVGWNIAACAVDVNWVYAVGRNESKFIADNGLENYNIMTGWDVYRDENADVIGHDINHCQAATNVLPYFNNNIFFNFNDGKDDLSYPLHKVFDEETTKEKMLQWSKVLPDVLYMNPEIELVYNPKNLNMSDYTLVYTEETGLIWKGYTVGGYSKILVRNDLVEELGLEEIEEKF